MDRRRESVRLKRLLRKLRRLDRDRENLGADLSIYVLLQILIEFFEGEEEVMRDEREGESSAGEERSNVSLL